MHQWAENSAGRKLGGPPARRATIQVDLYEVMARDGLTRARDEYRHDRAGHDGSGGAGAGDYGAERLGAAIFQTESTLRMYNCPSTIAGEASTDSPISISLTISGSSVEMSTT